MHAVCSIDIVYIELNGGFTQLTLYICAGIAFVFNQYNKHVIFGVVVVRKTVDATFIGWFIAGFQRTIRFILRLVLMVEEENRRRKNRKETPGQR